MSLADYVLIGLEILGFVITILLYLFERQSEKRRRNLGLVLLSILAIVVITIFWPRSPYRGWVICWHGVLDQDENQGYEFLAAYPELTARQGINLSTRLINPWNGKGGNYANDTLKGCLFKGRWYGSTDLDWYPHVS